MAPRVLVAPQELKGTLTAREAAQVIEAALLRAAPHAQVASLPLADGGPGTLDALLAARPGGHAHVATVEDALGRPAQARWATFDAGRLAVVELAEASGLTRLQGAALRPLEAHTTGTGQLLRAALDAGCARVLVGVGGSATTDGGTGAARALGVRFLDAAGAPLPPGPASLARLAAVDVSARDARLAGTAVQVLTDVDNPLLGPRGAARVYGPQKGAAPADVEVLEAALARLAQVAASLPGALRPDTPGAGAAGGTAWGLATFCGATLRGGFDAVAEALDLRARVDASDFVLTAEGRLDGQTTFHKGPWGLGLLARRQGRRAVCFAGACALEPAAWSAAFDAVVALGAGDVPSRDEARARLERAVADWARAALR